MQANELMKKITLEIADIAERVDSNQIEEFCKEVLKAENIFVTAKGRSNYISKCFAMRLAQLGLKCYCIDETNTPSVSENDILVICSGSGETEPLVIAGRHCLRIGAKLALITADANSTLAGLAHTVIEIPSYSAKIKGKNTTPTINIMGNQFETSMLFALDVCVIKMMESLGITEEQMMRRHKNIE